jgi:tRNA nucleotidyltransferase/poly(A) polymerase
MTQDTFQFFEVGGCVRDELLGQTSKDVDFSVVAQEGEFVDATEAFNNLLLFMTTQGFNIFEARQEFLTIRAKVPKGHPLLERTLVADFVLARKDGPSSDGRRPDWVIPGTLDDDLARRDFTVNAIARAVDGTLIDPFNGQDDIKFGTLRFVGDARQRISEDGLRVMRAFRFVVTKGFVFAPGMVDVLTTGFAAEMLGKVSVERIREELIKMFKFDTLASLQLLGSLPVHTRQAIFRDGLRLDATLAQ